MRQATDPGSRAAYEMYESAKGQLTVTSEQRALPLCHGTSERPSGRFPSERSSPGGSLVTGTSAAEKLRVIKSSIIIIIIIIIIIMVQTSRKSNYKELQYPGFGVR